MSTRVLSATGSLGMAPTDPTRSFGRALDRRPDVIVADAGSADVGPSYLGSNEAYNDPAWEEHDFEHLIAGAVRLGVPLIVGSCGVHGSDGGVDGYAEMVDRVARRQGVHLKTALIYSEVSRSWLLDAARRGPVPGLDPLDELRVEDVEATDRLVACMGPQPIQAALRDGAQLILAGRAVDDALFAAPLLVRGASPADAFLAGKLLENASLVATPFVIRESVVADVDDGVVLDPMLPEQRCTRASVAAQLMYERRTPFTQAGPGGELDLRDIRIDEIDERRVRVHGGRFRRTPPAIKVEGAGAVGYRSVSLAGCRDPHLIRELDPIIDQAKRSASADGAVISIHVFGRDAVMKDLEPTPQGHHEVALVIEALAADQASANRSCLRAKRSLFTARYPGQKATAGTVTAMLDELWESGPAYRWTVNHLVPVDDPTAPFRTVMRTLGAT